MMDVCEVILLLISFNFLVAAQYSRPDVSMVTKDDSATCTSKYSSCEVKIDDSFRIPGPAGPMGPQGLIGPPGEKGETGSRGADGEKGPKGDTGNQGKKGDMGYPGAKGETGRKGEVGPPGQNGLPGTCYCAEPMVFGLSAESEGTDENPLKEICKTKGLPSGSYVAFPGDPIHISCNDTSYLTCVIFSATTTPVYNHTTTDKPFWLSEIRTLNTTEWYGLSREHIPWLQKQSVHGKQTLRIYYKNFQPKFGREDATISLLTWNDLILKPYPSETTPIFYTKTEMPEPCDPMTRDDCYVDVELVSETVNRLPIMDIRIDEVPGKNVQLRIQQKELCFG
ncbi:collagen alpha-1(III) chain [Manduca sexta]|uniref:collagen alpha-1(III) chain n=1 Tax=Manduca sexta TaxID=7130 RepID=UPI00188EABF2|nr:collagen alpha-1(III) chain [Manduca sexta]